jgi:Ca2+-binding EF-hand superfamily protein
MATEAKDEDEKWKDTNVGLIGSDEDKKARHDAAKAEPAWEGAGQKPELLVWRIEKMKVHAWPTEEYGSFYRGDSYIVLRTTQNTEGKLFWDIYFWLGSNTSVDEQGTAAYKTVELDAFLDDAANQHREVEGEESVQFKKLFKNGLTYKEGGIESGFRHVGPRAYDAKLFVVQRSATSHHLTVSQVPMNVSSLNHGDCYVLDAGTEIIVWHGMKSSPFEKEKAVRVAENIEAERHGHAVVKMADEEEDVFWKFFGGKQDVKMSSDQPPPVMGAVGDGLLFRVQAAPGSKDVALVEIARGEIKPDMLTSGAVFVLDAGKEVFVWVGSNAAALTGNGMEAAMQHLNADPIRRKTHISLIKEGKPVSNPLWKDIMDGKLQKRRPTEAEKAKWSEHFKVFAKATGGDKIAAEKLGTLVRSLDFHPTQSEVVEAVSVADPGKTNFVSFDAFMALMKERRFPQISDAEMKESFLSFDTDKSGFIETSEFKQAMLSQGEPLTQAELDDMIRKWDKNNDGKLDYKEWCAMHSGA